MAAEVLPIQQLKLPRGPGASTPEQKYWRSFSSRQLIPSPNSRPITHISSPSSSSYVSSWRPSDLSSSITNTNSQTQEAASAAAALPPPSETFAVTSGSRVQIFSTKTRKLLKTISRFGVDDAAHSGDIRPDGRLVIAGGDSGVIQAFDTKSRAVLKTWREHRQPVWVTRWHPDVSNPTAALSASDDRTVRVWDLPSMESTMTFVGHGDYVRSAAWMPGRATASGLIMSGSYDQTVRLWDPRIGGGGRSVMCFKHEGPVESVLPLPSGMTVLAAAESTISVLDLVGARPLQLLGNHQKTVTTLALASGGSRVVSGGLDGHVKVYETMAWNVVSGFKYSSPVLALSVIASGPEREDRHLAVGLQSGVLNITTRLSGQQKAVARERKKEMQALVEGKVEEYDRKRGRQASKLKKNRGKGWERRFRGRDYMGEEADIIIDGNARGKIRNRSKWETALRKGQYERSLDIVLGGGFTRQDTLTLLTTLIHRSALRTALANRTEETLQPILRFLIRTLPNPQFAMLTEQVASLVLELYGSQMGQSATIDALVKRLYNGVRQNVEVAQVACSSVGMLEVLMEG